VNSIIVPDASVLLKWVLRSEDEANDDKALLLMKIFREGGCEIVLPSFWVYEIGNILGLKEPGLAPQLVADLIQCGFEEMSAAKLYSKALEFMRNYGVTFYDASYHATALIAGGTLLTADDRYYRKTKAVGSVCRLRSWTPPLAVL
jgi:predicted nucleic acid-binding protein